MAKQATAEIKGENLIITVPMNKTPEVSSTGKTLIVASTHGNVEMDVQAQGHNVKVGVNAFIKNPKYAA